VSTRPSAPGRPAPHVPAVAAVIAPDSASKLAAPPPGGQAGGELGPLVHFASTAGAGASSPAAPLVAPRPFHSVPCAAAGAGVGHQTRRPRRNEGCADSSPIARGPECDRRRVLLRIIYSAAAGRPLARLAGGTGTPPPLCRTVGRNRRTSTPGLRATAPAVRHGNRPALRHGNRPALQHRNRPALRGSSAPRRKSAPRVLDACRLASWGPDSD
jgi:hypothetical protein